MTLPFTILISALSLSVLTLLTLGYYSYRQTDAKGSNYFSLLMIFCAVWTLAQIGEYVSVSYDMKIFWSKMSYIGIVSVPLLFFLFALSYTKQGLRTIKPYIWSLFIIPIIVFIAVLTNEQHNLIWTNITKIQYYSGVFLRYEYGPLFYIHVINSYILMLLGSILFVKEMIALSRKQQISILMTLVAVALPWLANLLYISKIAVIEGIELTSFAFMLTGLFIFINVYKYKFLRLVPAAKELVYQSLGVGVIVLDKKHTVVDVNPVIETMLGAQIETGSASKDIVIGRKHLETLSHKTKKQVVFIEKTNTWLSVETHPLYDVKHQEMGMLVHFHDVSQLMKQKDETQKKLDLIIRMNKTMVNRELKMVELKERIKELEKK